MSDAVLAVVGWWLVGFPLAVIVYRERRAITDAAMDRDLMEHLAALRRAGEEQARDTATMVMLARYKRLTP